MYVLNFSVHPNDHGQIILELAHCELHPRLQSLSGSKLDIKTIETLLQQYRLGRQAHQAKYEIDLLWGRVRGARHILHLLQFSR